MVLFNSFRDPFGQGIFYGARRKNLSVVDATQRRRSHSLAALLYQIPAPADSKHTLHRAHTLGLQTTANVSGIETFPLAVAASNSEANATNEAVA